MADVNLLCCRVNLNTVRHRDASSSPSRWRHRDASSVPYRQISTESENIVHSIVCQT